MPDESPRAHFDRLKKQLQDSILRDYPNPERLGCSGAAVLQGIAHRPLDQDLEADANWQHVTHCSECYREFLDIRATMNQRQMSRQVVVGLGVAAGMIAVGTILMLANRPSEPPRPTRPQIAERIYRPRIVDLEDRSMTRSDQGSSETKPILLGQEPEELTIRLPFGSKAGRYEIQFLKTAGQPLFSTNGEAQIQNGITALTSKLDLSNDEPGKYFIGVRQAPWDWTYYPVVLQ